MKIYEVRDGSGDGDPEFFPTKKAAVAQALAYGGAAEDMSVVAHEIGKLTKAVLCAVGSRRGYSISRKQIYPKVSATKK